MTDTYEAAPDADLIWRMKVDPEMSSFSPARTLFVAQSWPLDADAARYFTDPSLALAAAAALTPQATNPVVILFYPGFYPQPLTLVSNVHLFGYSLRGTELSGALTWAAGVGVNVPQIGASERIYSSRIRFTGPLTINTTAKTASTATFDARDCDIRGNVAWTGRGASNDFFQTWDGVHGGTTWTFDGVVCSFDAGCTLAATINVTNSPSGANFKSLFAFGPVNFIDTQGSTMLGALMLAAVNVDADSSLQAYGSAIQGVLTVQLGGSADIRNSEYMSAANLAGAGAIDRTLWRTSIDPTVAGVNVITLSPPYLDSNYQVCVTQKNGTPAPVLVQNRQANQFELVDAAGGNAFELCIVKE